MSRGARLTAAGLALGALLALAGCASVPPYQPPAAAPAPPGTIAAQAATVAAPRAVAAPVDTTPSREALAVLATIPEPLAPGERVPAPAAVSAPEDSAEEAEADADTGAADVPVPAPTPVLGERPVPEVLAPADTTAPPVAPAPPALANPPSAPPRAATADTCWRVQIAATAAREKAARYLEAGRSQLLVPLEIEQQKGLFKVRTRDCMGGPAADALRRRALDAGFGGAFRFRGKTP
jgi:hypothetical protein